MSSAATWEIGPDSIKFENLMMTVTGGDAVLNGMVSSFREGVAMRDLTLDLHQFPSDLWLSLLVDPAEFAMHGPIGGRVVLNTANKNPKILMPAGKLILTKGDVQFNFLRAPIEVQGATLTMERKEVVLSMPGVAARESADRFQSYDSRFPQSVAAYRRGGSKARFRGDEIHSHAMVAVHAAA